MFQTKTNDILVTAQPIYLEDQSLPEEGQYIWAYQIRIENQGNQRIQLINRHWEIIDAQGRKEVVDGPGVVGEQPILEPGESYEYTSGCPLSTPSGFMSGNYEMEDMQGSLFKVDIPAFPLDLPEAARVTH